VTGEHYERELSVDDAVELFTNSLRDYDDESDFCVDDEAEGFAPLD
jgi:hypothetical protein